MRPANNPNDRPVSDWTDRIKGRVTSRRLLFVAAGLLVAVFLLRGCSGVDVTREEAVANATAAFESHEGYFEPVNTEARVLRQGIPTRAVWFVVFTVPDPDGSRNDFLHRATVRVDAGSGDVLDVEVTAPGN